MKSLSLKEIKDYKRIGSYAILMDKFIGSGQFGLVFLAFKINKDDASTLDSNMPLACKIIERE